MKSKFKKLVASFAVMGSIAAPVTLLVACSSLLGSNGAYDSIDDNKIVIQTTWSASGSAIDALEETVAKYNESQKYTTGYIPVVVEHVEGGYGTIPSQAITKIQSHDTRTLPNLYIDYPSAVGQIVPYKMAFDMGDIVKREWFVDQFVKVNDKIAGIKPGKLFSAPLSKSTEALIVDKPLMKYIFQQLKDNGATIKQTSGSTIEKIMNSPSNDESAIKSQWGGVKSSMKNKAHAIEINDDIFTSYKGLFEFVTEAQKFFEAPQKPNLLGLDSPSNTIYELSTLLTQNQDKDFLFTKNKKTGYVDFNFLEKGKKQAKVFKDSYSYIKKAIDTNSIWIGGGGAYGSTRLQKHKMAISISSSAGLDKAYSRKPSNSELGKDETMFLSPINKLQNFTSPAPYDLNGKTIDLNNVSATVAQGPSFNSIHTNKREDEGAKAFLKWFYTAKDSQSKMQDEHSNEKMIPSDFFAQKSSYIVPLKGAFDANSTIGKKVSGMDYDKLPGTLLGVKASFDAINREIKAVEQHPETSGVVDLPVDNMSGSIRKVIDSNILASNNSKNNGASSYNEQTLWGNVHRQAIIDQIIPDDGTLSTKFHYPNMMNRNFSDINWEKFSYVDAKIASWIDGDTPKVIVTGTSGADAVKSIKPGDELSIRIQGIDTPEAHVKMGELKYQDAEGKMVGFTDAQMEKLINKYKAQNKPLAVYSHGHYNELSMDKDSKYTYWKNIYVDIQTDDNGNAYDPIEKDSGHPNSTYNLRNVMIEVAKGKEVKLVTDEAKKEGYWGLKAGQFARQQMPAGTKIRIATDGRKSYNRVVGSIFYGPNVSKNWSVEILKKGLTLPFLSNPAAVLDETSILYHNGLAIADAFNYALDNKLGLFDPVNGRTLQEHLKNTLVIHGATDFAPLIKYGPNKPVGLPTDIYQYIQTRRDNRALYRDPSERIR
ncbi:P68 family surface lipoprotein [Mycoplasma todarodis]|uniref:P68 family surface lipoprotein n=1 Tax=Mycoplasma todarodis TaxID=1937191 RepID=UPI003B342BC0